MSMHMHHFFILSILSVAHGTGLSEGAVIGIVVGSFVLCGLYRHPIPMVVVCRLLGYSSSGGRAGGHVPHNHAAHIYVAPSCGPTNMALEGVADYMHEVQVPFQMQLTV